MSSLQIGLAVAGGLALVAVVAHGAWTSRKNAPRQAQPEAAQDTQPPPSEPVLDDPTLGLPHAFALPTLARRPVLDPLIDVIASMALDPANGPLSGEAALAAMPATRRVGSKPFAVEGLNAQTSAWETPLPGQRYSAFQAGVQLANRSGALNEIEYSEFVVKTQALADALGATPEFPEMRDEVARARELDQFASAHDAQLSFFIRARHVPWSPGYVRQNAARLGFVASTLPGSLVLPARDDGSPPLLALGFQTPAAVLEEAELADDPARSALREVELQLDVPQVDRAEQPFARMRETAIALAQAMDGVVTDANGQVLATEAMDAIAAELQGIYDTLERRDLAAGSLLARRLFS